MKPPEIHRISSHNATPHTKIITTPLYTPTTTHISQVSLIPDLEPPPAHEEEQAVHFHEYFEDPVHPHGPPPSPTTTAQECPPILCVLSFYHPPTHHEPDECPPTLCAVYRSSVHPLPTCCMLASSSSFGCAGVSSSSWGRVEVQDDPYYLSRGSNPRLRLEILFSCAYVRRLASRVQLPKSSERGDYVR